MTESGEDFGYENDINNLEIRSHPSYGQVMLSNKLDYVRLNVGSTFHLCRRDILMKHKDSVLAKYVDPKFDQRQSPTDFIIIDRDGKNFGTILDYIKDPSSLNLEMRDMDTVAELRREADYYALTELLETCDRRLKEMARVAELDSYQVPPDCKLDIVFDPEILLKLVKSNRKPVFVLRLALVRMLDKFTLRKLVSFIRHTRFALYGYAHDDCALGLNLGDSEVKMGLFRGCTCIKRLRLTEKLERDSVLVALWEFLLECQCNEQGGG